MTLSWNIAPLVLAAALLLTESVEPLQTKLFVACACVVLSGGLEKTRHQCRLCGYQHSGTDRFCLRCGTPIPRPLQWWVWVILLIFAIGLFGCLIIEQCLVCGDQNDNCSFCALGRLSSLAPFTQAH